VIDKRILICAVASVLGHFALGEALSTLPAREQPVRDRKISVTVINPAPVEPPPPEPPKPPEPTPEPPKPVPKVVREQPVARPVKATVQDTVPKDVPIPDNAVVAPGATGTPVFGVTMESTSQGGTGPAVQVGNTTTPQTTTAPAAEVKPQGAPVAAVEVTKMPLPQGRCSGKYTDAAREAGLEGVVVLDLVVDEKGRARDIKVVSGLEHGLTEAAITALKECQFSPGEKGGEPVSVRVRGFKIRFVMQDGD
jgi:protein TonB